jgi:hypothetical protein
MDLLISRGIYRQVIHNLAPQFLAIGKIDPDLMRVPEQRRAKNARDLSNLR